MSNSVKENTVLSRRAKFIERYFEPLLEKIGLSREQIESCDFDELNQCLVKINDAIAHPENFDILKLRLFNSDTLIASTLEAELAIGVLPLLLERKSLILRRIKQLLGERRVDSITDLVATVADTELRAKLEKELSASAEQSRQIADQESAVAHVQAERMASTYQVIAKLKAELLERRLRAWTDFLAKESMATYVGAGLVIILTVVHVCAMFLATEYKSEIINNAYLLLLGYFFGTSRSTVKETKQESNHGV